MVHLEPEALQSMLDGRTGGDAFHDVLGHLAQCEACQSMARAEARSLDVVMGASPEGDGGPESTARTTLTEGSRIGPWAVVGPLDPSNPESAMLALDQKRKLHVALRFVRATFEGVVGLLTQRHFWADLRVLRSLNHPHVLKLFDVGAYKDRVFLALELMDGPDAKAWLREQPRAWPEVLKVFLAAARGLAAAHATGLVHGAFFAHSIRVGRDGRVKVADFGMARLRQDQPGDPAADQAAFMVALTEALAGSGAPSWLRRRLDGEAPTMFELVAQLEKPPTWLEKLVSRFV